MINEKTSGKPFYIKYTADYPVEYFEDKVAVSPFMNLPISENKLKQPERKYPVDMNFRKKRQFSSTLILPEGYEILKVPEDFRVNNALIQIDLKVERMDDAVMITGLYCFKKAVYPPKDYSNLRYYYKQIIKRFNDKIILMKTDEASINVTP